MPETVNMYAEAKTWNPFKGCEFDCVYCIEVRGKTLRGVQLPAEAF